MRISFIKVGLAFLAACLASGSGAAVKYWSGAGADSNFSTPGNWSDGTPPAAGDHLVFGDTSRCATPHNDFEEGTAFAMLLFTNDGTGEGGSAETFHITGNKITLTGGTDEEALKLLHNTDRSLSGVGTKTCSWANRRTEVIDLEIDIPKNTALNADVNLGTANSSNHHVTFKKKVRFERGLSMPAQCSAILKFEGGVENFTWFYRPNGTGTLWLCNGRDGDGNVVPNTFGENTERMAYTLNQGTLRAESVSACTPTGKLTLHMGQGGMSLTAAYFEMDCTEDSAVDVVANVKGPNLSAAAGSFRNLQAGTTLTVAGTVNLNPDTADTSKAAGLGLDGAGDGRFEASIAGRGGVIKSGEGTWELAGTSDATDLIRVAGGRLSVGGDYSAHPKVETLRGAELAGTGKVARVEFADGSSFAAKWFGGGSGFGKLKVLGAVRLEGVVKVKLDGLENAGFGTYEIMEYAGLEGGGVFELDGAPDTVNLITEGGKLRVAVNQVNALTWKGGSGEGGAKWDATEPNWVEGLYADGATVTFPALGAGGANRVEIPGEVRPAAALVKGGEDYTFTGAGGLRGDATLRKSGAGVLRIENTNDHYGVTVVSEGAMVNCGKIASTKVTVQSGAAFTNTAAGRITGMASLRIEGGLGELAGTNDFTGGLFVEPGASSGVVIKDLMALGAGDVAIYGGTDRTTSIEVGMDAPDVGAGRKLSMKPTNGGMPLLYVRSGGRFAWLGDVEALEGPDRNQTAKLESEWNSVLQFGAPGVESRIYRTSGPGFSIFGAGTVNLYSRFDMEGSNVGQTHGGTYNLYSTNNKWGNFGIAVGRLVCHATNALAREGKVALGQNDSSAFRPTLDLNGYDQTVKCVQMYSVNDNTHQTVTSGPPAVLTFAFDGETLETWRQKNSRVKGKVTICKRGTGTLAFRIANESEGDFRIEGGTVKAVDGDVMPVGRDSRLTIARSGAALDVAAGVRLRVSRFSIGTRMQLKGTYGRVGTPVAGAVECAQITGDGVVEVTRGDGGMTVVIR